MRTDAESVEGYLAELPDDRRAALEAVRRAILDRLPDGYEENLRWGMICYEIPLERSGPTYNGQPLMYAALASPKRHMALYLTGVYADEALQAEFRERYLATGRKLDMGKSCVRFKSLDDLPLDVVGDTIAAVSVERFVELADRGR